MAINKAKIVDAAQKLVTSGKIKDAIAEYQKVLKEEPKDLNTLNSVGDLYVRLNNVPEALNYFTRLADIYVSDGFLVRGIAMYKKISKLDLANTTPAERLAELYTMQGLFNEARAQYLQVAEAYLNAKKVQEATKFLQKVLDLEPDNLQIQQRLAELYKDHGRKEEATAIYQRVAERLLQREETDEALKWLDKAAQLTPENPEVLLLQAQIEHRRGQPAKVLSILGKFPKAKEHPQAMGLLLEAQLATGDARGAEELAEKLFAADAKNFAGLLHLARHAAQAQEGDRALGLLKRIADAALEHDATNFAEALRGVASQLAGSAEANQLLERAARQTNNHAALVEALNRQARTATDAQDFSRAKQLYEELLKLEPDNPDFPQALNRVREKMGEAVVAAAPVEALAAVATAAPAPAGELDEQTQAFVNSALTEIDLFSSYGMTDKAIDLAEQVVARAPSHIVAHEKLLDFYVGSGKEEKIVEVARRIEQLCRDKGDLGRAEEVAQLAARYTERVGAPVAATPTEGVREVDLSAEWGSVSEAAPAKAAAPAAAPFKTDEVREEIGFYLTQGMFKEAGIALDRYAEQYPAEPVLAELRQRLQQAATPAAAPARAAVPAAETAAAPEETYEVTLEAQPQQAGSMSATDFFADLAGEIDAALPAAPPPGTASGKPSTAPAAPVRAGRAETQEGVAALAEVFDEFKQELGEVEQVEDIETHYNLGIAFKEMGLYDESISEFQKVYKSAEQQKAYANLIQCCTLLGMCFLEKGMPQIAVGWYERALKAPGIDPEGVMAIRYDMGVAHEQAGDRKAALSCFMEVYGLNVDYRDVSDRIRELQQ